MEEAYYVQEAEKRNASQLLNNSKQFDSHLFTEEFYILLFTRMTTKLVDFLAEVDLQQVLTSPFLILFRCRKKINLLPIWVQK